MGINVHDSMVEHDDSHSRRVVTSLDKCPMVSEAAGFPVHFVFRRVKERGHKDDGNPLIYALKKLYSYEMRDGHRDIIMNRAREIVGKINGNFDGILVCPSSNEFNFEFAAILSQVLGIEMIDASWLDKAIVKDAIADLEATLPDLQGAKRDAVVQQLNSWNNTPEDSQVSMKQVGHKARKFVRPIVTKERVDLTQYSHLLVADDLMASGATLVSTMQSCIANGAQEVSGICFMSRLGQ